MPMAQLGITEIGQTPDGTKVNQQRQFVSTRMTRIWQAGDGAGQGLRRALGAGSMRVRRCRKQRKLAYGGRMLCVWQTTYFGARS